MLSYPIGGCRIQLVVVTSRVTFGWLARFLVEVLTSFVQ